MEYSKGTIVFVRGTRFEDNNQLDPSGHPAMIPIASDDVTSETYYLLITSNVKRILIHPDFYYDLTGVWDKVHLLKPSLINLRYIYKAHIKTNKIGGLPPSIYQDVICSLKKYQKDHPCKLFHEVENKI